MERPLAADRERHIAVMIRPRLQRSFRWTKTQQRALARVQAQATCAMVAACVITCLFSDSS